MGMILRFLLLCATGGLFWLYVQGLAEATPVYFAYWFILTVILWGAAELMAFDKWLGGALIAAYYSVSGLGIIVWSVRFLVG